MRANLFFLWVFLFESFNSLHAGGQLIEVGSGNQSVPRFWRQPASIKWRYRTSGAPTGAKALIEESFKAWTDASGSQIAAEYSGEADKTLPSEDGYSDIYFNVSFSGLGLPPTVIAITLLNSHYQESISNASQGIIREADILINPSYSGQWVTGTPSSASDLDLREMITHEIGHALGLSHSLLIDSVMYPSKPASTSNPSLIALFRVPKRTLSQDDISSLNNIYPIDSLESTTVRLEGSVEYNNSRFIGAHVVALKNDEDDLSYTFFPSDTEANLLVKGMENVAAYSLENGEFRMGSLKPGQYTLLTYGANGFMGNSYSNLSSYLAVFGSTQNFPIQFWDSPDCANGSSLDSSNLSAEYAAAGQLNIAAGQIACDIQILAHTGRTNCGGTSEIRNSCGGGGCEISPFNIKDHPGVPLIVVGFLLIIWSSRRSKKKFKEDLKRRERELKDRKF